MGYRPIVSVVGCNADNSRRVVPVPILQGIVLIGGNTTMLYYIIADYTDGRRKIKRIRQHSIMANKDNPYLIHFINANKLYIQSDCQTVIVSLFLIDSISVCCYQKGDGITLCRKLK